MDVKCGSGSDCGKRVCVCHVLSTFLLFLPPLSSPIQFLRTESEIIIILEIMRKLPFRSPELTGLPPLSLLRLSLTESF